MKKIECESVLEEIRHYKAEVSEHSENLQSALLKYLLAKAAMQYENFQHHSPDTMIVESIKQYIDAHFRNDITNQSIAACFGYHPYHLNTVFSEAERETIHKYIDRVRLNHARDMLIHTNKPIGDIACECGFKDASYFSKFFLKYMNLTPKQYRNLAK